MVNRNLYLKIIGSVSLIVLFALLGSVLLITGISYFFFFVCVTLVEGIVLRNYRSNFHILNLQLLTNVYICYKLIISYYTIFKKFKKHEEET